MVSLDVGCGCVPRLHNRRGDVGLDLHRGLCDVVGDACWLPFRDACFDKVFLYDILEHLEDPLSCLAEVRRVMKNRGEIEVSFPVDPRHARVRMLQLFLEGPFIIPEVLAWLWRQHKYGGLRGWRHVSWPRPCHIRLFFRVESIRIEEFSSWCFGRKGKILRRIMRRPLPSSWRTVLIRARAH